MKRLMKESIPALAILFLLTVVFILFGWVGIVMPFCIGGIGYIYHSVK